MNVPPPLPRRRAVFLDRDDTVMVNVPYLNDPAQVRLFPDTIEALSRLQEAGWSLVLVSNQSGIARGLCTLEQVHAVNAELCRQLHPITLDGIYFSPDGPDEPSDTRKPAPGLIFRAADELGLDVASSVMIGDKPSDIECARNAGCTAVWLDLHGAGTMTPAPDYTARTLSEAAAWILRTS
jgi:D-glycero-D-manno-heptose 1,7-bisphosphate phosphatase